MALDPRRKGRDHGVRNERPEVTMHRIVVVGDENAPIGVLSALDLLRVLLRDRQAPATAD